ncbi:PREDICTED: uncharacterized protein LOC106809698 [Priapulus caudatus]|uniref:Uncharacterized protein LOC106809698 n=1 Tax=Priapulus caudatus TaxID=37621 RepID=A0ABM1E833_PRICU|nr:PREDICTED: uncharacterized protein LOC106809698 [Priapulus caudatus]
MASEHGLQMYIDGRRVAMSTAWTSKEPSVPLDYTVYLGKPMHRHPRRHAWNIRDLHRDINHVELPMESVNQVKQTMEHPTLNIRTSGYPSIVPGQVANALYLNGRQQFLDLGTSTRTCLDDVRTCRHGFTVRFWMKSPNLSDKMQILSLKDALNVYYDNGRLYASVNTDRDRWVTSYDGIRPERWYFVELSWDPDMGLTMFVNSQHVDVNSVPVHVTRGNRAANFYVGRGNTNMQREKYGNVNVDEMEVWDARRALLLSLGQIKLEEFTPTSTSPPIVLTLSPTVLVTVLPPTAEPDIYPPYTGELPTITDNDPRFQYVSGQGYLRLELEKAGIHLTDDFQISTTFATYQKDALLWYLGNRNKNIHLSLQNGYLNLTARFTPPGYASPHFKVYSVIRPQPAFSDGNWHTVTVKRRGDKLWMYIDDAEIEITDWVSGLSFDDVPDNVIYFGGTPDTPNWTNRRVLHNLHGYLKKIFIETRKDVYRAIDWMLQGSTYVFINDGVDISYTRPTQPPITHPPFTWPTRPPVTSPPFTWPTRPPVTRPPITWPTVATPAPPTRPPYTYPPGYTRPSLPPNDQALSFLGAGYISMDLWGTLDAARVSFEFTTYAPDGVLVFTGGNPVMAVEMKAGRLYYVQTHGGQARRYAIDDSRPVHDGRPHRFAFTRRPTLVEVSLDGNSVEFAQTVAAPRYTHMLIGGVPEEQRRLLPADALWTDDYFFHGCIKDLTINNFPQKFSESMQVPSVVISNEGRCTRQVDHCALNPCRNGGRCYNTESSYFCDCSSTEFQGLRCQTPTGGEQFSGGWYQVLRPRQPIIAEKNEIKLRFRTAGDNRCLLSTDARRAGYMYVCLENGRLKTMFNLDGRRDQWYYTGRNLADNRWHTATIVRDGADLTINVDNGQPTKGTITGQIPPLHVSTLYVSTLYVGAHNKDGVVDYSRLWNGYISHIYFNSESLLELPPGGGWNIVIEEGGPVTTEAPITRPTRPPIVTRPTQGVITTPSTAAPGVSHILVFNNNDLMKVYPAESLEVFEDSQIELSFRTTSPYGYLMSTIDNSTDTYIHLYLHEGKLRVAYNTHHENGKHYQTLDVGSGLNDGRWHKVQINHRPRGIVNVKVDNKAGTFKIKDLGRLRIDQLNIGGLQHKTDVYDRYGVFSGDIRDVVLDDLNFINMYQTGEYGRKIRYISYPHSTGRDGATSFNKDYYLLATLKKSQLEHDNYLWLIFNTGEANTGLASVSSRDGTMRGSLNLVNGKLVWTMMLNGEILESTPLGANLNDLMDHRVFVHHVGKHVFITLDDMVPPQRMDVPGGANKWEIHNINLGVGTDHGGVLDRGTLFNGTLKGPVVNGKALFFFLLGIEDPDVIINYPETIPVPSVQHFDGTFYVEVDPSSQDYEEIKFDFLTSSADTALLTTTSSTRRDAITIALEDGQLRAYIRIGDKIQQLIPKNDRKWNDQYWHTLSLSRFGNQWTLRVDNHDPEIRNMPAGSGNIDVNNINIGVRLLNDYFGYFNNRTVFDGEMRLFTYNGVNVFDLRDGDLGYRIDPHHPIDVPTQLHFDGSTYMKVVPTPNKPIHARKIALQFRTKEDGATLLSINGKDGKGRVLELKNGNLRLVMKRGGYVQYLDVPGVKLNDGRWHMATVSIDGDWASLSVDGQPPRTKRSVLSNMGVETK